MFLGVLNITPVSFQNFHYKQCGKKRAIYRARAPPRLIVFADMRDSISALYSCKLRRHIQARQRALGRKQEKYDVSLSRTIAHMYISVCDHRTHCPVRFENLERRGEGEGGSCNKSYYPAAPRTARFLGWRPPRVGGEGPEGQLMPKRRREKGRLNARGETGAHAKKKSGGE